MGRAHRGMSGKRKLYARREDPELARVRRILRRQHEHRLRIVELTGDLLHSRFRDSAGVGKNRKLVAAENVIGEYVEGMEAVFHRAACLTMDCCWIRAGSPRVATARPE